MTRPLDPAALDQLFYKARSYNGYLDKPVHQDQMDAIWELMKYGPTSANALPARLVWCVSDAAKEKLASLTMPANGDKIRSAPVTVIIGYDARRKSDVFAMDTARVCAAKGVKAMLFPHVVPTPVLAWNITETGAAAMNSDTTAAR